MFKKYPHLSFVVLSYILAILFFVFFGPTFFENLVRPLGLGGMFVAGMMYSYSFTVSIGALLLPAFLTQYSIAAIAIIGGLGGTFADITIFRLLKGDLKKEMKAIGATKLMKRIRGLPFMRYDWFRDVLGLIAIASPLPNEVGIAIMASTHLPENMFRVIALVANIVGIYLLVSAASVVY